MKKIKNPTACIIIIGNEILSGRTVDTNRDYLCKQLNAIGIDVIESRIIKEVIQIIKDLEIPFVDLNEELFQKHKDPLSLYPFRSYGHFNELGYKTISEIIFKKFYKN